MFVKILGKDSDRAGLKAHAWVSVICGQIEVSNKMATPFRLHSWEHFPEEGVVLLPQPSGQGEPVGKLAE